LLALPARRAAAAVSSALDCRSAMSERRPWLDGFSVEASVFARKGETGDDRTRVFSAGHAHYVAGIDIGLERCVVCCLSRDKRQIIKPCSFPNDEAGLRWLFERLQHLSCPRKQILIGLEATSRYGENLWHALQVQRHPVVLLHPGQMHAYALQRGMRAKTDRVDALRIACAVGG
ncbi:MAG: transposase, partial [Ktedonobacteraceae bacterium]|nr:transposase [Ktedonobacteraceae bacterium]